MSTEKDFEAWYAEQGRLWADNPRRKQYPLTADGVQEALKDASRLAYQAATERAAKLAEEVEVANDVAAVWQEVIAAAIRGASGQEGGMT